MIATAISVAVILSGSTSAGPCNCSKKADDLFAVATEIPDQTANEDSSRIPPIDLDFEIDERPMPRRTRAIEEAIEEEAKGEILIDTPPEDPRERPMEPMACTHYIHLYDTYGDGWNGGSCDVYVGGILVLNDITLGSGSGPATYSFSANTGDAVFVDWTAGSYPSENYFDVEDGTGALLVNDWYPNTSGDWNGTGNCDALPGPCDDVISIDDCGSSYAQTYVSGGSGVWDSNPCYFSSPGTEQVYSFVAPTTGTYSIQVTADGTYVDYNWQASSCAESGWTCIDDISASGEYGSMSWTAGTTYYILLDDENTTASTHTFYVNCPAEPSPGDDCSDPIVVDIPADLTYTDAGQTNCGRTNDYSSTCLGSYDGGEDIIYELNVTSNTMVDIEMTTLTTYTGMSLSDVCPPGLTCIDFVTNSLSGGVSMTDVSLTTGTYYLMIDTWPSPDCIPDFTLVITEVGCETPGTPTSVTGTATGATTANLSWSAGTPAGTPTVTYYWVVGTTSSCTYGGGGGAVDWGTTTGTSTTTSALTCETTYYLRVYAETDCDGTSSSYGTSSSFVTDACPTPGDDCSDPIVVDIPADLTYTDAGQTNCGRTNDYSSTCLGSYDGGEDIIYELNVTSDTWVDIEMTTASTYTGMSLSDACPPGLTCIDYVTNSGGGGVSMLNVFLSAGTYYLMIDTWPLPDCIPDFDLVITEVVGCETPGTPTSVTGTATGETTADLSWSAGTPAGSATVTYYWVVGTSPTVTYGSGVDQGTTTGTSASTSALSCETDYYLRVYAETDCDGTSSGYGTSASFTTNVCTCIQIGSGTSTNSYFPIYSCYGYNYSQQIYTESEITAAGGSPGPVDRIKFYYDSGGTTFGNWENWTVYMGNTTKASFTSTSDWIAVGSMTEVFSGVIPVPVAGTWLEITLSTPFTYTGDNIVIAVDENSAGYSCTAVWRSYTAGSSRGLLYYSDGTNPDPASPPSANYGPTTTLAQVQFCYDLAGCETPGTPTSVTGTATGETTADLSWSAGTPAGSATVTYYWVVGTTSSCTYGGGGGAVDWGTTTGTSATTSALSCETTYYLRVYAETSCDLSTSDYGTSASFTTDACPPCYPGLWTGASNTNWDNINNWDCTEIPTVAIDVTIPDATSTDNDPTINTASAVCANIEIETDGILNGGTGTLTLTGNWTDDGTFNPGTGTIIFEGTGASTIDGPGGSGPGTPIDENFDSGIPGTWTVIDGGASADTWFGETDYLGSTLDGTPFVFVDSDAAGSVAMDEILESPEVNTAGATSLTLEFDHYYNDYSLGTEIADVDVWDGALWQNVYSASGADVGAWGTPDHQSIDIVAYANSAMKVRFHYYNANYDMYWAVDNVVVSGDGLGGGVETFYNLTIDKSGTGVVNLGSNISVEGELNISATGAGDATSGGIEPGSYEIDQEP